MKTFQLTLPTSLNAAQQSSVIESSGVVVFIGANGAGKTRIGSWIESSMNERVHRVAAQKSLSMPESSTTSSINKAETLLLYGHEQGGMAKSLSRWQQKPNTYLLNDYPQLMVLLFSDEFEQSTQYRHNSIKHNEYSIPPTTKLDVIKRIWEATLPHRELIIGGGKIETTVRDSSTQKYNAAEMSDGERVIFYLIGQCLCAPRDGVIIIDEPELHLHRSIQAKLWDEIEAERPDCLFIYLTHDLDFAASRTDANKIWLESYDGAQWNWLEVPESDEISEELLLNLLGSRKPILFVEGDKSSLDHFVYCHLYPEETVIPCGGCSHVIQATLSFTALRHLHRNTCRGLIDRDYRSDNEIEHLKTKGVGVLRVSEVENLFLTEEFLRAMATHLHRDDADAIIDKVKTIVFNRLEAGKQQLISSVIATALKNKVKTFDNKAQGKDAIKSAFQNAFDMTSVDSDYDKIEIEIADILSERNYKRALEIFNPKNGMLSQVGPCFGMDKKEFVEFAKRLLSKSEGESVKAAMRQYLPSLTV